jgi:hypothetical protein
VQSAIRAANTDITQVMSGDDDPTKEWLDNMAGAIAQAIRAPYVFERAGMEKTRFWADTLKLIALRHGALIREETYVIEKILPAIDQAMPVK